MSGTPQENLKAAIGITREMNDCANEGNWKAISKLETSRVPLLQGLTPEAAGVEGWRELTELNQKLIQRLEVMRGKKISDCVHSKRQRKNLAAYRSTP